MKKNIPSTLKKLMIFSMLFSMFIYFTSDIILADTILNDLWSNNNSNFSNASNFQAINTPALSNVWVAIATSIGTDFFRKNERSFWKNLAVSEVYDEILEINDMINNPEKVRVTMIQKNMIIIKEYLSFLKNDIQVSVDNSENRSLYLDSYVSQLEFRYKNAVNSQKTLLSQKLYLEQIITESNSNITQIKTKLNTDFKSFDDRSVSADIEDYLEQKERGTVAATFLVFTNKFLEQYEFLNNYNKELLDTLILNKKAISTDSYVVIPDSWDSILKSLDLLYEEQAFKLWP